MDEELYEDYVGYCVMLRLQGKDIPDYFDENYKIKPTIKEFILKMLYFKYPLKAVMNVGQFCSIFGVSCYGGNDVTQMNIMDLDFMDVRETIGGKMVELKIDHPVIYNEIALRTNDLGEIKKLIEQRRNAREST